MKNTEFNLEDFQLPLSDLEKLKKLPVAHRDDPRLRGESFDRLFHWLEDDRDRRQLVVRADNMEIWWAGLYIDHQLISAAGGYDLDDVLDEILAGMVARTPEGGWGTEVP